VRTRVERPREAATEIPERNFRTAPLHGSGETADALSDRNPLGDSHPMRVLSVIVASTTFTTRAPGCPFDFKAQHDFDLHVALKVAPDMLELIRLKRQSSQIETRGIANHGFVQSVYFRDPNG